jgi:hypothetical protein
VPLALALAGLVWGDRHRTLFWGAAAAIALLFAMGAATPVHRVAYELLPLVKRFRAPSMMISIATFAMATLAGIGFDAAAGALARESRGRARSRQTRAPWRERGGWIMIGATGVLLLLWLVSAAAPGALSGVAGGGALDEARAELRAATLHAFPARFAPTVLVWVVAVAALMWLRTRHGLSQGAAGALLGLLLVADLWRVDARYLSVVDISRTFAPTAGERFLAQQEAPFRILPIGRAIGPNTAILNRLESVTGLQKFRLAWYDVLQGGAAAENLSRLPLWRVLNLRYVASERPLGVPGFEPVAEGPPAVYRWGGEAPRAWLATDTQVVSDSAALRLLSDPDFDVRRIALLPRTGAGADPLAGAQAPPQAKTGSPPGAAPAEDVRYLSFTPNRLEAEVRAGAPAIAVFSEAYHPYWKATVDGRAATLLRADLAFRGVRIPAGTHRVVMEYEARAFERGRLVSLLALAGVLGYAVAVASFRVRRRRRGSGTSEERT